MEGDFGSPFITYIDVMIYFSAAWHFLSSISFGPLARMIANKIFTAELGRNLFYCETGEFESTLMEDHGHHNERVKIMMNDG